MRRKMSYREAEEKFYRLFVNTPDCPECGEPCSAVKIDDSFSYSGTHCTGGQGGIHRVPVYYVSDCCEAVIEEE